APCKNWIRVNKMYRRRCVHVPIAYLDRHMTSFESRVLRRQEKGLGEGMITSQQADPRPHFLMCPPRHFAVTYSINPWMDPAAWQQSGDALHGTAVLQWQGLLRALRGSGASVDLVEPEVGLPDLVFTANSAVVLDGKALLARFRHPQRQGEEAV